MIRYLFPLLLPGLAQAACPTAADMAQGVRFTSATGEVEDFRLLPSGLVESTYSQDGANAARAILARGIYLVESVSLTEGQPDPGTRSTFSFPDPANMPDPVPGGTWTVTVATFNGGNFGRENQIYSFGTPTRLTWQACGYDMMPITIQYPDENDAQRRDVLHYLPELGLSYLAEFHDKDMADVYTYSSLEVIP